MSGKKFNTTGICIPSLHYMVDTTDMIDQIIDGYIEQENILLSTARVSSVRQRHWSFSIRDLKRNILCWISALRRRTSIFRH